MSICIICGRMLRGRQQKYCTRKCKNDDGNNRFQSYALQQARGRKRKLDLLRLKGSRCRRCGYDRNYSALEFHHRNPDSKEFQLDLRSLSNRSWNNILGEAGKCDLVCSNCHKEIHNPQCGSDTKKGVGSNKRGQSQFSQRAGARWLN